jgi:hypothetical protein
MPAPMACPLCGAPVDPPETVHPCYEPLDFERLFRYAWWTEYWRAMQRTMSPMAVRTALAEFARAKAQGREATRRFALSVYRSIEVGARVREQAVRDGKDPKHLVAGYIEATERLARGGGPAG